MADDFQLIIQQMKQEREDKKAADKRAEDKAISNDKKQLKAFEDAKKKDTKTLLGFRNALQESLKEQKAAEKRRAKEGKELTKKQAEKFKAEQDAIKEKTRELLDSRKLTRENERIRLEDRADRIRDREEIKDIRSKERKELDERKSAFEKFKESIAAKGEDPEKNAQVREEGIKLRKEEFALRVKNLEGTDLMAARLEELGNDLKDKGLDPEKNREFQKESLNLQRAQLRERLKNAESKSERKEILKEQAAKDKRALSFSQKQMVLLGKLGDKFSDLIPSQEGVATGIFGFLKKAALIGLLLFLPKILNSKMAKDLVQKVEDNMPAIKDGLLALGKFFVDTAIAVGNVALILLDLFTGDFKGAFDRLSKNTKDAFDEDPENENSLIGKLTLIVGALGLFKFAKLLLNIRTIGGIIAGMVGLSNKTITDSGGGGAGGGDKKLSKKNLKKEGLKLNKAGKIVDAKTGKFASNQRITQAGFKVPVAGDKMKQLSKIGKIGKFLKRIPVLGYILSLGTVAATLMNKDLSGKEKAKRVGAEVGGLAGAGVMAMALSFIPGIGTLAGGLIGYFGGKALATKLFEFLLGDSNESELAKDLTPADKGLSGGDAGGANLFGMGDTGGGSGGNYMKPSDFKTTPKQDAPPPLNAGNMFPAENAQINQTIIDSSRKTSNNNYQQGTQNVTRMSSYGMTGSAINSI